MDFPDAFTPDNVAAHSVESGEKGSIFVSGKTPDGKNAVTKYDRSGHLITKFGSNGYAPVPFEVDRMAYDTVSGSLYIAGSEYVSAVHSKSGHVSGYIPPLTKTNVARLAPSGKFDTSFGTKGVFDYRLIARTIEYVTTSTETINPLPDGSVLLGVDRATRYEGGSADQDLVLIKLRPNGTYDTRFGTNGITQVINGHFEPNYALDVTENARGFRGVFSDVQVDADGSTRVAMKYGDGTRYYREDYPNVELPLIGKFYVLSRTVTARGKLDRSRSAAWEVADNTHGAPGAGFTYVGFDGRALHASISQFGGRPSDRFELYLYTLKPARRPTRRLIVPASENTYIPNLTRSANGTYAMTDSDKHAFRLRGDFTTDPSFGVKGVATGTNSFVGFENPSIYADDLGRVLVFEYAAAIKKYVLDRFA